MNYFFDVHIIPTLIFVLHSRELAVIYNCTVTGIYFIGTAIY
ncbi:hypothetical protein Mpsy_2532 [Methanolobus psychrophilus R15]|nr:hypothetical protein Mpsy_2532 [Methanolobus psychrophilus R15]